MCQAASFVLTENEVYFSEKTDSHEEIISENGLVTDGAAGPNILRIEINPTKDLLDLSSWEFRIDQDEKPKWFDAECDEARARSALVSWWKCRWDAKTKTFSSGGRDGRMDLRWLTSLPANAKLSSGGNMDLSSLTSLPAKFDKSKIKGTIYLKN